MPNKTLQRGLGLLSAINKLLHLQINHALITLSADKVKQLKS
jgi:hypothetical protein